MKFYIFKTKNQRIKIKYNYSGQLLLELLLAIGLSAVIFPAIIVGIFAARDGRSQQGQRLRALELLQEANEAVRSIRERGWSNLYGPDTYYPQLTADGKQWQLATGSATVDGYTTRIIISDVYRSDGAIVPTPGVLDKSTKKIDVTVSWNFPFTSSIQSSTYLTRYLENDSYVETTQPQFNYTGNPLPGVKLGVTVNATNPPGVPDDGEVNLSVGSGGDWCQPSLLDNAVDVPLNGVQKAIMAKVGQVFIGTGGNASGDSLDYFTVSNTTPPIKPVATKVGSRNKYKTYGLFGDEEYAYLTTDHPTVTFEIVKLSDLSVSEPTGTGNTGTNGVSIFVLSNIAYVTSADNKLYTFNLSTKTGAHSPTGSIQLAGKGNKVIVNGNYAYIAEEATSNQLQIVELNPDGLIKGTIQSVTLPGLQATDLTINATATRAYVVTKESGSQRELYIIDIDPTSSDYLHILGSYDTSGMSPTGIAAAPGSTYVLVGGIGGENYQVVKVGVIDGINYDVNPQRCAALTLPGGYNINGLVGVYEPDGDVFTYLLTTDKDYEFKMIIGGYNGASAYTPSGVYESQTFDPGYITAKNRITVNYNKPNNTDIKFQVSLASKILGTCPQTGGYTYVGPDGTPGTYFTPSSGGSVAFPLTSFGTYSNPGQCFRYRAYLTTTDYLNTPALSDVTINFSP